MDPKPDSTSDSSKQALADAHQKAKSFNQAQYFTEGALIDAMDNNGSWRVARISQIKNDVATLSFDGWSSKWDEVLIILYVELFFQDFLLVSLIFPWNFP